MDYGRGFVFYVGKDGQNELLMDAKGVGTEDPKEGSHSDGLGYTLEMVQDYLYEKLIHKICVHSQSGLDTIENYAVLDFGFKASKTQVWPSAGMLLRQAHKRYSPPIIGNMQKFQLPDEKALQIEKVIRRYGITSAGINYGGNPDARFRCHDIQGSEEGVVVDFGTFMGAPKFNATLLGMDDNILMDIKSPEFVQPVPGLCVTGDKWAFYKNKSGEILSNFDPWAFEWLSGIESGENSKEEFSLYVDQVFQHEQDRWSAYNSSMGLPIQGKSYRVASPDETAIPKKKKHWWNRLWRSATCADARATQEKI
jgi:hypothetical protein